jgi:hypothetical protein
MKNFFTRENVKGLLKVIGVVLLLVAVLDVRVSWQMTMPKDGEQVCSLKAGEGYEVSNGIRGVFLRREPSLDARCSKVTK